jgi:hypothetical protein
VVAGPVPGKLVGTMTEDSAHVVFPETPEEEEGEQGMQCKVDISCMAEHTKQVLWMLPNNGPMHLNCKLCGGGGHG